nr:MAG TPA: Lactose operon repressor-repressor, allosteric, tetramer, DNA-binding, Repressor [Caudoviricetes sp.]
MAEILMKYGARRELAKKFGVSEVTVRDALKFRTKSKVANMVRKAALEMGGSLIGAKTLRQGMEHEEEPKEQEHEED